MITALISDIWPWAVGAVLAVLGLLGYGKVKKTEGRKAERSKNELRKLKDDKATAERIDNAKPADTPDDARANLRGWLSWRK